MRKFGLLLLLFFVFFYSCVEPYNSKSINYQNLLVVEGFISTDMKQHQVAISTTSPIGNPEFIPETGAEVSIKEEGSVIPLTEGTPGLYLTPPLQGVVGKTYQLFITTKSGRQLLSEEITLKDNPGIKNVYASYSPHVSALNNEGGFQIFLDAKDSTGQALFYRWEYEETWEIRTPFESNYYWVGGNDVLFRSTPVSTCYGSDTTSNVLIQSTQGLSEDKVESKLIQTIPRESLKLQFLYSMLVRQYTLSAKAFLYWQALLKTNQTQGSLSDVQPGTVFGNISSSTDKELVLGYFDACVVKEKRIFIEPLKFRSSGFTPTEFEAGCKFLEFTVVPVYGIGAFFSKPENSNMEILGASGGALFLLPKQCCDCTSLGTTLKPSFWP